MPFRDINPAPLNPLAYGEMVGNIGTNILAGEERGMRDALLMDRIGRDVATRNALAGYFSSAPEERSTRFNELAAIDPRAGADALAIESAQREMAMAQRKEQALKEYTAANAVLKSDKPALALRLLDSDGTFLKQLEESGLIDSSDGISDDEARMIAEWARDQTAPFVEGDERAEPAAIREMRALGYPLTPEGFAEYNAARGSQGGGMADQLALIQAQLAIDERRDRLERERREDRQAQQEREQKRTALRNTLRRSIAQTEKIADLTQKLEGTFLEAGMPASSLRRSGAGLLAGLGSALGIPTDKLRKDLDAYDQLKKNMSDQLINLMESSDLGEVTNAKLQQYQNALASTETSPGAIMAIQANIAEILLDEADAQGIEVFDRDKFEANIERWRSYATPADEAIVDIPAIERMTREQIEALVENAENLSQQALEAAAKRWDELNAASE